MKKIISWPVSWALFLIAEYPLQRLAYAFPGTGVLSRTYHWFLIRSCDAQTWGGWKWKHGSNSPIPW